MLNYSSKSRAKFAVRVTRDNHTTGLAAIPPQSQFDTLRAVSGVSVCDGCDTPIPLAPRAPAPYPEPMRYLLPILLVACESATPDPGLSHPLGTVCTPCASDVDCAAGLACDHRNFACKTPKMLQNPWQPLCEADCWDACAKVGNCHLKHHPDGYNVCAPSSPTECAASDSCHQSGATCDLNPAGNSGLGACTDCKGGVKCA